MFSKDAIIKILDNITLSDRKAVYKTMADKCQKLIESRKDILMSLLSELPFNINTTQCDPIPMLFDWCFLVGVAMVNNGFQFEKKRV